MISQLRGSSHALRSIVHISNSNNEINLQCMLSFYYKICNNFLGNSSSSGKIFTLQKKIARIMAGAQLRSSYKLL